MTTQNRRERFWTTEGRPEGRMPWRVSANRKGRAGWHQATPNTSQSTCNSTGIVSRVKAAIVTLAVWGWVPLGLAEWINRMGEPRDE